MMLPTTTLGFYLKSQAREPVGVTVYTVKARAR